MALLSEVGDWIPFDSTTVVPLLFVSAQLLAMFCMHGYTTDYHQHWYPLFKDAELSYLCWLVPLLRAVIFVGMGHTLYESQSLGSYLMRNDEFNMELLPLVLYGMQILSSWTISFFSLTSKRMDDALHQLILMDTATASCVLLSCWLDLEVTYWLIDTLFFILFTAHKYARFAEMTRCVNARWEMYRRSRRNLCIQCGCKKDRCL